MVAEVHRARRRWSQGMLRAAPFVRPRREAKCEPFALASAMTKDEAYAEPNACEIAAHQHRMPRDSPQLGAQLVFAATAMRMCFITFVARLKSSESLAPRAGKSSSQSTLEVIPRKQRAHRVDGERGAQWLTEPPDDRPDETQRERRAMIDHHERLV